MPPCESSKIKVSGQLPLKENCLPVRVGVWVKVRISFGVGCNQTIALEEKCPQLVLGAIVLEPKIKLFYIMLLKLQFRIFLCKLNFSL